METHPELSGIIDPFRKEIQLDQNKIKHLVARYDAKIYYHDIHLGILKDFLINNNLLNETIIIITADHGEEFFDHGGWNHGYSLYEELIHVPLIFHCPGLIVAGKRISEMIAHVDVLPTILSLCGISSNFKFPYKIEGLDMSGNLMLQSSNNYREHIFSELNKPGNQVSYCLRYPSNKAIISRNALEKKYLFFDLQNDPHESLNIWKQESPIQTMCFEKLESILKDAKARSFKPSHVILDEKTKEQLKSLGYIKYP
jgi:arylsulfatase A-like enzyme